MLKKIALIVTALVLSISVVFLTTSAPALATDNDPNKPKAAILTGCAAAEDGNGGGIYCILRTAVDILTIAVGTLGIIGIIICGVQYLTAGGNEEQVRKSKRRIFEIIIGIAAFLLVNVILNWLLPDYQPDMQYEKGTSSSQELSIG